MSGPPAIGAGQLLLAHEHVLVPEMNLGQLALLLRGRSLVDVISCNQVRGLPFTSTETVEAITSHILSLYAAKVAAFARDDNGVARAGQRDRRTHYRTPR